MRIARAWFLHGQALFCEHLLSWGCVGVLWGLCVSCVGAAQELCRGCVGAVWQLCGSGARAVEVGGVGAVWVLEDPRDPGRSWEILGVHP